MAEPRVSFSKKLAQLVLDLTESMTIQDTARYVGLDWHQVAAILTTHLEKKEKQRSWRNVRLMAIDEIAVRKGHRYMTVVVDLESGDVLDVIDGRNAECLAPVFERLKKAHAPLEAVAIDLSSAYIKAIKQYAPKGIAIVHDPFHLVQLVNRTIDEVRRQEQKRVEEEQQQKLIKGSRYLLLHGKERLQEKQGKASRLAALLEVNETLNKAYMLKEDLRLVWRQKDKKEALNFLNRWIMEAIFVSSRPFRKLAKTIALHRDEILAWYDFPISTGPLEGLNNKIKVLNRRAFGYRNLRFYRLRILFIHQSTFKLTGT